MSLFETKFNEILHTFTEITDNNGKTIDNVKINDIVKTPDGAVGRYIKKKEYAILDLGNGQVKEAEIDSLQLIEPAEEDEEKTESVITEDDSFKESKILYVVGYKDKDGKILYLCPDDDLPLIWYATLFDTEEDAKAEIEHEHSAFGFDPEDYFVRPIKFCY